MSKFRYEVKFESAPVMSKEGGRTTLSETVYCDEIHVEMQGDRPVVVEFLDEEGVVFSVNYSKYVSAERVSGNNNDE